MNTRRPRWIPAATVAGALVAGTTLHALTLVQAQDRDRDDPPKAQGKAADETEKPGTTKKRPGGLRVPVGRVPKARAQAEAIPDPLNEPPKNADANAEGDRGEAAKNKARAKADRPNPRIQPQPDLPQRPVWPFHYNFRIAGADGTPLLAEYYPAQDSFEAPALILLPATAAGRSSKDFSTPIEDLKGETFARHMQKQGFAVLVLNPRAPSGGNRDASYSPQDWRLMIADVQNAYRFLIDRNNRGEINLSKLAVVALGDGANLAAAWAGSPDGGVANEGRLSDIGALALVSPLAEVPGLTLARTLPTIATRFPLLAISGDRDQASVQAVRDQQRVIERHRLSRAAFYDTSLHAGKLLTFFPKIATSIERFLDVPVKNRKADWEPRFLLEPVVYRDIELIPDSGFEEPPANPARADAKAKPAEKQAADRAPDADPKAKDRRARP